jgi:hypothetical protein
MGGPVRHQEERIDGSWEKSIPADINSRSVAGTSSELAGKKWGRRKSAYLFPSPSL